MVTDIEAGKIMGSISWIIGIRDAMASAFWLVILPKKSGGKGCRSGHENHAEGLLSLDMCQENEVGWLR